MRMIGKLGTEANGSAIGSALEMKDKVSINIYVRNTPTDNAFTEETALYSRDLHHGYEAVKHAVDSFLDHLENKEVTD